MRFPDGVLLERASARFKVEVFGSEPRKPRALLGRAANKSDGSIRAYGQVVRRIVAIDEATVQFCLSAFAGRRNGNSLGS